MPALEQFRAVASLLPNDVDAAVKLAAILQAHSGRTRVRGPPEDQLRETAAAWERVLELEPRHHDAHLRLGIAREDGGAPREAPSITSRPSSRAGRRRRRALQRGALPERRAARRRARLRGRGRGRRAAAGEQARAAAEGAKARRGRGERAVRGGHRAPARGARGPRGRRPRDARRAQQPRDRAEPVRGRRGRAGAARASRRDDETLYAEMAADARADEAIDQLDAVLRVEPGGARALQRRARALRARRPARARRAAPRRRTPRRKTATRTRKRSRARTVHAAQDAAATKQRYGEVLNRAAGDDDRPATRRRPRASRHPGPPSVCGQPFKLTRGRRPPPQGERRRPGFALAVGRPPLARLVMASARQRVHRRGAELSGTRRATSMPSSSARADCAYCPESGARARARAARSRARQEPLEVGERGRSRRDRASARGGARRGGARRGGARRGGARRGAGGAALREREVRAHDRARVGRDRSALSGRRSRGARRRPRAAARAGGAVLARDVGSRRRAPRTARSRAAAAAGAAAAAARARRRAAGARVGARGAARARAGARERFGRDAQRLFAPIAARGPRADPARARAAARRRARARSQPEPAAARAEAPRAAVDARAWRWRRRRRGVPAAASPPLPRRRRRRRRRAGMPEDGARPRRRARREHRRHPQAQLVVVERVIGRLCGPSPPTTPRPRPAGASARRRGRARRTALLSTTRAAIAARSRSS